MKIASISENYNIEKRIAITPEIAKKYIDHGFELSLSRSYGEHLGFKDQNYIDLGAKIFDDDNKVLENSNLIVQLGLLSDEKSSLIKENQTLVGVLNPYNNKDKINNLVKKKNKCFFFGIASKNYKSSINGYTIIPG
tara:strand:- start:109 stop:519 length:411 start_codon:yes stop_codon:yes gene_type:complete